jgi:hypothetical protein
MKPSTGEEHAHINEAYTTNSKQRVLTKRLNKKRTRFKGYIKNFACE